MSISAAKNSLAPAALLATLLVACDGIVGIRELGSNADLDGSIVGSADGPPADDHTAVGDEVTRDIPDVDSDQDVTIDDAAHVSRGQVTVIGGYTGLPTTGNGGVVSLGQYSCASEAGGALQNSCQDDLVWETQLPVTMAGPYFVAWWLRLQNPTDTMWCAACSIDPLSQAGSCTGHIFAVVSDAGLGEIRAALTVPISPQLGDPNAGMSVYTVCSLPPQAVLYETEFFPQ